MSEVFHWPRALHALTVAAETGALTERPLYPVEVSALCALTGGMQISEEALPIAPDTFAVRRDEYRGDAYLRETRARYLFAKRLKNGYAWRVELLTRWAYCAVPSAEVAGITSLKPRNIEQSRTWVDTKGAK